MQLYKQLDVYNSTPVSYGCDEPPSVLKNINNFRNTMYYFKKGIKQPSKIKIVQIRKERESFIPNLVSLETFESFLGG